jgi:hypothetical protein
MFIYGHLAGLSVKWGFAFCGQKWLGKQVNVSLATVCRAVKELVCKGLVEVERFFLHEDSGRLFKTAYFLPALPEFEGVPGMPQPPAGPPTLEALEALVAPLGAPPALAAPLGGPRPGAIPAHLRPWEPEPREEDAPPEMRCQDATWLEAAGMAVRDGNLGRGASSAVSLVCRFEVRPGGSCVLHLANEYALRMFRGAAEEAVRASLAALGFRQVSLRALPEDEAREFAENAMRGFREAEERRMGRLAEERSRRAEESAAAEAAAADRLDALAPEDAFSAAWMAWPQKQAEKDARDVFLGLRRKGGLPPLSRLLVSIAEHRDRDDRWRRGYVPNFGNWLRGARWLDRPFVKAS